MDESVNHLRLSLPWQHEQRDSVLDLQAKQQLPHALILTGDRGIGKLEFALAICHLLLCDEVLGGSVCGRCKQCELNRAGTHPDLMVVAPEEGSALIKIDQIRRVVDFLGKTSQQGKQKLVVIDPAEGLNINAANALLKSLEEPTADSHLFLVSHRPSLLLPTIRSRCQQLALPLPERDTLVQWLAPSAADSEQIEAALAISNGRPLAARDLLTGGGIEQLAGHADELLDLFEGREGPVGLAGKWHKLEIEQRLLPLLQSVLAAAIRHLAAGTPLSDTLTDKSARALVDRHQRVETQRRLRRYYEVNDQINAALLQLGRGNNPNKQLLLEHILTTLV